LGLAAGGGSGFVGEEAGIVSVRAPGPKVAAPILSLRASAVLNVVTASLERPFLTHEDSPLRSGGALPTETKVESGRVRGDKGTRAELVSQILGFAAGPV